MIRSCVVVGGGGAVGTLFVRRLLEAGREVCVVDTAGPGEEWADGAPRPRHVRGDITEAGTRKEAGLGRADLVLLALPEQVALDALPHLAGELRPGALLAETLSVKQPMAALMEKYPGVETLGLNPMFAPSLGFEGRPVAAVVRHGGPLAEELLGLVESWGSTVVRVDAAEHDRLAGASQALTHAAVLAFGTALAGFGPTAGELRDIAPPPHRTLLALLARVLSGAPEVYWDVQYANPEAPAARRALADGIRRLATVVEEGAEDDFGALLDELRDYLGPDLAHHRDVCARLFGMT
ncbi:MULTISPECIES: NAD-binding protein [unclassified Streptomyces]|uniref:NAD-binding protein n=1 Tax=unclassified Streptomyces TaxID=2593676 RepID=UPI0037F1BA34